MRKIILDTNGYTSFLAGDEHVLAELAKADIVYMSIFVLGELNTGFEGGRNNKKNKKLLDKFLKKPTAKILDATFETSEVFGKVKNSLKQAGTPLPINDIWIASHALETGSVLVTYDNHFSKIPGLRIWDEL